MSGRYALRKIIIAGIATAMGVAVGLAPWSAAGQPGGPGAQKSDLTPVTGGQSGDCNSAEGGGAGFAILNAPGQPDVVDNVLGEVSLKAGLPDTDYEVALANVTDMGDACMPVATLHTNNQGNGNAHFDVAGMTGTYFVVLNQGMGGPEVFASAPVGLR
jgi:hypothetical protein